MNKNQSVFYYFKWGFVAILFIISTRNIYALNKDCWADFFDEPQYAGKHFLIEGPAKLANLYDIQGANWDKRIHSIKVGPKTKITVYQNPRFELTLPEAAKNPELMRSLGITEQDIKEDSELIFNENAMIHDLGDFYFHKKIRSLKVECN
jgi:Beta/Gamma crystallin